MEPTPHQRAILHFRACLVVLCLHYSEYIKSTILETLEAAYPKNDGWRLYGALNRLMRDRVITPTEKDDLLEVIQYRNDIAHRIHELAGGLGLAAAPGRLGTTSMLDPRDHDYLVRLRRHADSIVERLETGYRVPFAAAGFLFQEARDAYEAELERLAGDIVAPPVPTGSAG